MQWLSLGDGNNSFFHRSCKNRWNVNKILMLEDLSGNQLTSHSDIATHVVDHFKRVLGSSKSVEQLDPNIVLPSLSDIQQRFLCSSFSNIDMLNVFKKMAKRRSPGPDGLTPEL